MNRRQCLQQLAAALASAGVAATAHAQDYPARPIRMIVPWPAGGLVDIAARQLGTRLQAALGQPVVVENRVGAGGTVGADAVAKAAPDGYTFAFTTSALTINAALQSKLPFDALKDFEPIALVAYAPSLLVVGPAITPASVKELTELARNRRGTLNYASAGNGSPAHLAGELFKSMQKLDVVHVPFTGAPAALNDQIAGRIDFQFANAAVALPQVRAGKVKAIAVTSTKRFAALPDVPTMAEAGVADFEAEQWLGLLAPRGLPGGVTNRIATETQKALGSEEFRAVLLQAGMSTAAPSTPAAFASHLQKDLAKWSALIKAANIKAD